MSVKFSEKLLWCTCFSFYIPVKFKILSLNITELTIGDFFLTKSLLFLIPSYWISLTSSEKHPLVYAASNDYN